MSENNININKITPLPYIEFLPNADKLNLPPQEHNLLKISKKLGKETIARARKNQEEWRENMIKVKERQKKLAEAPQHIRTDKTLAERKIKEKNIEKLQKKIHYGKEKLNEHIEKKKQQRKTIQQEANENAAINREEEKVRKEEYIKRLQKKHDEEIPPEEVRIRHKEVKDRAREKSIKKLKEQKQLFIEYTNEKAKKRKEKIAEFDKELREKVLHVDIIEKEALERAKRKNALTKSAEKFRIERRTYYKALFKIAQKKRENKIRLAFDRFEKLRNRMKEFVRDAGLNHEEVSALLQEIVRQGKERREETLFLSGSPIGLMHQLGSLEFFKIERKRIEKILSHSEEHRLKFIKNKEENKIKARKKIEQAMFLSGNPKELYKRLKSFEYFLWRENTALKEIIKNALKRHEALAVILSNPTKKHYELYRIFHKMVGFLWNPVIASEHQNNYVFAESRKNPHFITRKLIQRISLLLENTSESFILMQLIEEKIKETFNKKDKELNKILQNENYKALFNSFISDKSEYAEKVISSFHKGDEVTIIANNILTAITKANNQNKKTIQLPQEIIIELETLQIPFNTIQEIIEKEIGIKPDYLEIDEEETREELKGQQKLKQKEKKEKIRKNNRLKKQENIKEYYKKLIEETNLTAHEKVNNERNLIDLFF